MPCVFKKGDVSIGEEGDGRGESEGLNRIGGLKITKEQ